MLELHFLGRGAAFYPAFGNNNAYFTADGDLYFLDFGEAAYAKVLRLLDLTAYRHIYVLLTHLHADHVGSLASLISYTYCRLHVQVTVVHPLDTVCELLRLQGIAPHFYRYAQALPSGLPVQAEPVEVPHAADMRAFGYRLTYGDDRLYYSGDAAALPDAVRDDLLSGRLHRIYQDTASHPSEAHCWYQKLADAVPPADRARVYCMHLDCDMVEQLRAMGFSVVEAVAGAE